MANKDDEAFPWLLLLLGILGGGFALAAAEGERKRRAEEARRRRAQAPRMFACHNCGTPVVEGTPTCSNPACGVRFEWPRVSVG